MRRSLLILALLLAAGCARVKLPDSNGNEMRPVEVTGTIRGRVIDGLSGGPLEGIQVIIHAGAGNGGAGRIVTLRTRADGTYEAGGLPAGSQLLVTFKGSAGGVDYRGFWQVAVIPNAAGTFPQGGAVTVVDGVLIPLSGAISGSVAIGGLPAAGVTVTLREAGGVDPTASALNAVTDGQGRFSIDKLAAAGVAYLVEIEPPEGYFRVSRAVGSFDAQFADWSGVAIDLVARPAHIAHANIAPDRNGDGKVEWAEQIDSRNLLLDPQGPITVHFTVPVATPDESLTAMLLDYDGVALEHLDGSALDAGRRVLRFTPSAPLAADANPDTLYRLRFANLSFVTGEKLADIRLGTTVDLVFDVARRPALLDAPPAPRLYIDNERSGSQAAVDYKVDSGVIRLYDDGGRPLGGYGAAAGLWSVTNLPSLVWNAVEGAVKYNLYTRNINDPSERLNLGTAWKRIATVTGFTPVMGRIVHTGGADLFTGLGFIPGTPWEFGNRTEVAVTAEDNLGHETPLTRDTPVLTLHDGQSAAIDRVTYSSLDAERGSGGIQAALFIYFSERMNGAFLPDLEVQGGLISEMRIEALSWNLTSPGSPVNQGQILGAVLNYSLRGACVQAPAGAIQGAVSIAVRDARIFKASPAARLFFPGQNQQIVGVKAVGDAPPEVLLTVPLSFTLPAGAQVCAYDAPPEDVTALISQPLDPNALIAVGDANLFYIGAPVIIWNGPGKWQTSTVNRLDSRYNLIGLSNPLAHTYSPGSTLITYYWTSEYAPRGGTVKTLGQDLQSGFNVQLELPGPPNANYAIGDYLLFDRDGSLQTTDDQERVRIAGIIHRGDGTASKLVLHQVLQSFQAGRSTMRALGDHLRLDGTVQDLSGNIGIIPSRDEALLGISDFAF